MKGFNTKFIRKRNKYGAIKTVVDGITFDSKAEAREYGKLKLLERAGEITNLRVHTRFPLHILDYNGEKHCIGCYEDDFDYTPAKFTRDEEKSRGTVIDVKGVKTALYLWKKKHFELQYGIKITEITK